MKIGILTYHRVVNDGSVMQAYCLQNILKNIAPDAVIELIDYCPRLLKIRNLRSLLMSRFPFINISELFKQRSLHAFLSTHCTLSSSLITDDISRARHFIKNQAYDAIVVGSDTVWEIRRKGGSPVAPNIYFLSDIRNIKKIAFAVSADKSEESLLVRPDIKENIRRHIRDFDFISVRDTFTRRILTERFGIDASRLWFLPDPTLLWDFSELPWSHVQRKGWYKFPLAGIALADVTLRLQFTDILKKNGFQVINLIGSKVEEQVELPVRHSLQFRLGIYRLLDFLVTDRFHGMIFGLKLGRGPAVFVERSKIYEHGTSKGAHLLGLLGMESMVYRYRGEIIKNSFVKEYGERWRNYQRDLPLVDRLSGLIKSAELPLSSLKELLGNHFSAQDN